MLRTIAVVCVLAAFVYAQQGPPPFLQNAPPAKQQEFQQLVSSFNGLTDAQADKKVQDWINKQDPSIKSAFAAFQSQVKSAQAAGEAAHKAAISKFSPAAKDADAKLTAIANDASLSVQQKGEKIDALMNSLPANVRSEIQSAMQG